MAQQLTTSKGLVCALATDPNLSNLQLGVLSAGNQVLPSSVDGKRLMRNAGCQLCSYLQAVLRTDDE